MSSRITLRLGPSPSLAGGIHLWGVKRLPPSVLSWHDTCLNVIENIRDIGSGLPQRSLPSGKYFGGGTIGGAPKSIYPVSPAPEYVFGQGHGVIPDGITHPLMTHLASDEPCALKPILVGKNNGYTPHYQADCGVRFTVKTATPDRPTYTSYERGFLPQRRVVL